MTDDALSILKAIAVLKEVDVPDIGREIERVVYADGSVLITCEHGSAFLSAEGLRELQAI